MKLYVDHQPTHAQLLLEEYWSNPLIVKFKLDQFWGNVVCNPLTHCWEWEGKTERKGYGQFTIIERKYATKRIQAHRFAYLDLVGEIPEETLDHICENHVCVNVIDKNHIVPASNRDNLLRVGTGSTAAKLLARTHCEYGHEFSEQNSKQYIDSGRVRRRCLICKREYVRRHQFIKTHGREWVNKYYTPSPNYLKATPVEFLEQ